MFWLFKITWFLHTKHWNDLNISAPWLLKETQKNLSWFYTQCLCVCVHVCVLSETKASWQVKGLVSPLRNPQALTESRGGLEEWRGEEEGREDSIVLAWVPDQPPASLNNIDRHCDISQHMPSILSLPSLTCHPAQHREHYCIRTLSSDQPVIDNNCDSEIVNRSISVRARMRDWK